MVVTGDDPFNPAWVIIKLWARGRNARCGAGSGREVIGGRGNVTDSNFVHGLTKGILKVTPFIIESMLCRSPIDHSYQYSKEGIPNRLYPTHPSLHRHEAVRAQFQRYSGKDYRFQGPASSRYQH